MPQKPYILSQLDEIYRLVRDLIIYEEKKIRPIFLVRVPPLVKNSQKIFLIQIWSNHAPIDRSRRAE